MDDLDLALARIKTKILNGLKNDKALLPGFAGFVAFLIRTLEMKDHLVLDQFEKERDNYELWLIDIMVESGRYVRDGEEVELVA